MVFQSLLHYVKTSRIGNDIRALAKKVADLNRRDTALGLGKEEGEEPNVATWERKFAWYFRGLKGQHDAIQQEDHAHVNRKTDSRSQSKPRPLPLPLSVSASAGNDCLRFRCYFCV